MDNYLEGVKRAIEIIVEEQTTEHESDSARFAQTVKRLQEIVSNRLDGVVMPKIADIEKTADKLSCEHLTDEFGDPRKHWCYPNVYQAILFTLQKLNDSNFTA